jgi:hypothetical protein
VRGGALLISSARVSGVWSVDRDPQDVGRQEVGRELDPPEVEPDCHRQRVGQGGLAHAGHILEEYVTVGQERGQGQTDDLALAVEHGFDFLDELIQELQGGLGIPNGCRGGRLRHVGRRSAGQQMSGR